MSTIVANTNVTLDGVMQAPGRPDEDTRGGFEHGGWGQPYFDEVMGQKAAEGMAGTDAFLFGRRTYEDFASVWPTMPDDNPFAAVLNERRSTWRRRRCRSRSPGPTRHCSRATWARPSTALKEQPGKDIVILGSGKLVRS